MLFSFSSKRKWNYSVWRFEVTNVACSNNWFNQIMKWWNMTTLRRLDRRRCSCCLTMNSCKYFKWNGDFWIILLTIDYLMIRWLNFIVSFFFGAHFSYRSVSKRRRKKTEKKKCENNSARGYTINIVSSMLYRVKRVSFSFSLSLSSTNSASTL